jgi:hypothetical protein
LSYWLWKHASARRTVSSMFSRDYTSNTLQAAVMQTFLATHPTLISRDELRRELGSPFDVDDALAHLGRHGLVHRVNGPDGQDFFWATRAAMAAEEASTAHLSSESRPVHSER